MNNSCSADGSDQRSVSKAFTDLNSNLNNPHATDKHGKNVLFRPHLVQTMFQIFIHIQDFNPLNACLYT